MYVQKLFRNLFLLFVSLCFLLPPGCQSKKEVSLLGNEAVLEEYQLPPKFLSPSESSERIEAAHDFHYKNDSAEEIVLTLESTSCGCTRAKIVPEKIAPGEITTISLAYDLSYAQENRSETVIIKTNQEPPKRIAYRLRAVTFPRLEVMKKENAEIVTDPGKTTKLTVLCRSYQPKTEESHGQMILQSSSDLLIVPPTHAAETDNTTKDNVIMSERKYSLELLSPGVSDVHYDYNGYTAQLILKNDDYQINFPIKWKPKQYIDPDKTAVFFNCRVDPIENEQVILNSVDEFAITSIETEHGLCEVQCHLHQSSRQHQIKVSANVKLASNASSANKDVIILSTDHPLQPQIRLAAHFLLPF